MMTSNSKLITQDICNNKNLSYSYFQKHTYTFTPLSNETQIPSTFNILQKIGKLYQSLLDTTIEGKLWSTNPILPSITLNKEIFYFKTNTNAKLHAKFKEQLKNSKIKLREIKRIEINFIKKENGSITSIL
jgi:hypothetical protein